MSFLFPLYLLGALAIGVPLYLHLKRLPPKDAVEFSSLMFLRPTREIHIKRRSKLEHILLLLLRCAAVLLLALIFARPFVNDEDASADAEGMRQVILVDTSASMRRGGMWDLALEKVEEELKRVGAGRQLAVYRFDRIATPVVDFDQWSKWPEAARVSNTMAALETVKPGWDATDIGAALATASDAIADVDATDASSIRRARDRILVISDWQEGAKLESLSRTEWPEDIEVASEFLEASGNEQSNAAISWVRPPDGEKAPRVRVRNDGLSTRSDFTLSWKEGGVAPLEVHVAPGESIVVSAPAVLAGAPSERRLTLTGDDIDFDNSIVLAADAARRVRILYVGEQDAQKSALPFYYLKRVFPKSDWFKPEFLDGSNPEENVAEAEVVVVAARPRPAMMKALKAGLREGKRMLFLLMDDGGSAFTLKELADWSDLKAVERDTTDYFLLENLDFDHPMLQAFNQPRLRDFSKVRFWKYRKIDMDILPEGAVLVSHFDTGDPAIIDLPVGKGSLAIFTAGWHPRDSQLARSTKFPPLLFSVFDGESALDPERSLQRFVGERVPNLEDESIAVTQPDGNSMDPDEGVMRFRMPGIHKLGEEYLAVNLAPAESLLQAMPVSRLEPFGVILAGSASRSGSGSGAEEGESASAWLKAQTESRQKYWQWLIVAVFLLLMLETWIAARRRPGSALETNPESQTQTSP